MIDEESWVWIGFENEFLFFSILRLVGGKMFGVIEFK